MIKYSIIVPTLNQSRKLNLCLTHLYDLDLDPTLFEVLVIDNGSIDSTKDVVFSFNDKILDIYYYYCSEPGLMAARHMGADLAKGEILCYLDDDSLVTKEWPRGIQESFRHESVVLVGGPCVPRYESDPPSWISYFWEKAEYGEYNAFLSLVEFGDEKRFIYPGFVFGCNFAVRKRTFFELRGTCPDYYPEEYRQYMGDGETALAEKIFQSGFKAMYNPRVKIEHLIPSSRLTVEYFCWRATFNGIHASYRTMRRQHGLDQCANTNKKDIKCGKRMVARLSQLLGCIKRKCLDQLDKAFTITFLDTLSYPSYELKTNSQVTEIKIKVSKSFDDGFEFHQERLRKDPKLVEWVLRENYLGENGKLPR